MRNQKTSSTGRDPKAKRAAWMPAGQSILALEKRIAFDGAAVATATKVTHAIDAAHADTSTARHTEPATPMTVAPAADRDSQPGTGAIAAPKSVVFIESDVPDIATLIKDISPTATIVMLDASKDGMDAIASYLDAHKGVENVYIFSHGSDAHLSLGTADLDAESMQGRYASDLATIKASLGANANLLVYGCDFAEYADGDSAAHLLSQLTGASVAASTDLTGGTAEGGDFVLEDRIGAITAPDVLSSHISDDFVGLLATQNTGAFTITTGTSGSTTSNQTIATATTADGAIKIVVTVTPNTNNSAGSLTTLTSGATFDNTAPSSAYTTTVNGASALEETLQFGGTSGGTDGANSATITIAYFDAKTGAAVTVTNPIINIDRLGGSAASGKQSVSDSSDLTLTTSGATLTKLSGSSSAFNVTSTDIYETVNTVLGSGYSADANADPTKGTAAGSVQVMGSYSTVTFNWAKASNSLNGGDRVDFIFSADTAVAATGTLPAKTYTDGQSGVAIGTSQAFSNPSGLATTYSVSGLPAGLSIDSSTGIISGTIDHDASKNGQSTSGSGSSLDGTYKVVVTATNDAGNAATQTFTIDSTNQAPVLGTTTAGQSNYDGDTIAAVDASKAFSDPNGDPLTYTASGLAAGLSISSAGLITGTVAKNATPGTDSIVVTATDDKGAATTETFSWIIKDVPPAANGTLANQTYKDGQSGISIDTSGGFVDSNGNALSYSAVGLPAGLTLDPTTGKITGTIDHDASKSAKTQTGSGATLDGKYTVTITASDALGGRATQTFTIDSTNQAPVLGTKTVDQTNTDGDTIAALDASKAFSDPNGDTLSYAATGLPPGLVISAAGTISGTVTKNAAPGTYSVMVTASDDKGATTTETFNWIIKDLPPAASGTLANQTVTDGQAGISIATASGFADANGNPLTYSASGLPAGLAINATTGVISGTVDHDASKNAKTHTGSGATLDGTYAVVVTASDALGGSTTQTFKIDSTNQAPMVGTKTTDQSNSDGDTITALDSSKAFTDPNGDPLTFTASNLPPGLTMSAKGVISGTVAKSAAPGTYAVVVTATDDKGATTTETFNWVIKNVPPAASGTLPNQSYTDGQTGIAIATASGFSDANGNTLTYSATGLPAGLSIDSSTGKITGTISSDASKNAPTKTGSGAMLDGTYNVVVTAKDGLGGVATQAFNIDSRNQAPVVGTKTADQSNSDGDTIASVDASKAFSDPSGSALTFTASNLPAGLSISPAGLITGTIAKNAAPGTYSVLVSATDDKGASTAESFNWIVKDVAPTASGTLANQAVEDGQSGVSIATAGGFADTNGNPLTYAASGLPAGLAIDAATGKITGTVDHDASKNAPTTSYSGALLDGTYTVVVTASDGLGGTATQTFTIDSSNQAPVVGTITPNQTSKDGQTVTPVATAGAFTDPNGDPLTYSATNLPAGLSIDATTGQITGTISSTANPGTYAVRVLATDDKGASSRETFNWVIQDVPPAASGTLANQTFADSTAGIQIATAGGFTSSNGLTLSYSATGLPAGLSIDAVTGKITGQLDHDASKSAPVTTGSGATLDGTYTVTVTASDGQGGTATQTFTIDATNTAPVVVTKTVDQSGSDGAAASIDTAQAFNDANTGDVLTYAATGLPKGVSIDPATGIISGTIDKSASVHSPFSVTITATDDKGAATSETFQWAIANVAPTATPALPDRSAYDGSTVSYATSGGFTNPNSLSFTYSATGLPSGLTIDPASGIISGTLNHDASVQITNGAYTVAVTVNDGQGGTATNTFHVVASNQAPSIVAETSNQASVDGQTIATLDASQAFSDPNGDPLTFIASNLPAGLVIDAASGKITGTVDPTAKPGSYAVAVTATDDKGLATTETFTWTVNDAAPIASGSVGNATYPDSSVISIGTSGAFTSPNHLPLTYTATGLPTGLSIDPGTGRITGQLDHDASEKAASTSGSGATLVGSYAVIVTASDGQGGSATTSFTIDASNTAPAIVRQTPTQNSFDGNTVSLDTSAVFKDANTGDVLTYAAPTLPAGLTIDPKTGIISGTIDKAASTNGPVTVTVTATDDKGAATTETFTWNVSDVVPVAAAALPDQAAKDSEAVTYQTSGGFTNPNGLAYTYSASGLPSGLTINATTGAISGTLDHDASAMATNGKYAVTVSVNDGQGGTATTTFALTVTNQAPVLGTKTADQSTADGAAAASVDVSQAFADPNAGDVVTYMANNLPKGLTIDPSTGIVSGTVAGNAAPGTYAIVVTATDDKGAATTEVFNWTVTDVAPGLGTSLAARTVHDSDAVTIDTTSGFTNPNNLTFTYSATGLPVGLRIDPASGQITGTIDHDASAAMPQGIYQVTVTASDGQGGTTSQTFAITSVNDAPTITAQTKDQTSTIGNPASLDTGVAFTDANLGDVVTYSSSTLPPGLSIDPKTGLITGTIASSASTTTPYSVQVTATDDKGASVTETFAWTIDPVPASAVSPIPNLSTFDGSSVTIDTAGNFSGTTLMYSATNLPLGLSIDKLTGKITGTLDHDASKMSTTSTGSGATLDGFYSVSVTATASDGTMATQTFVIDSANQAPNLVTANITKNQTTAAGQQITTLDTASAFNDPNTGDVVTYAASQLPAGLSIDATSGQIAGTVAKTAATGTYSVLVTATDDKGASTVERFTWTVTDVAPTATGSIAAQSFPDSTSGISIATGNAFASPNGLPLVYSATGLPKGLSIDPTSGAITGQLDHEASVEASMGAYQVVVTASDGQGGTATQGFTITATNNAPTLVAATTGQTSADSQAVALDTSAAFHDPNTGDVLVYSASNLPAGLSIDPNTGLITGTLAQTASKTGTYSVTVTATDDKGAATSETFTWTVADLAPSATPPLADQGAHDGDIVSYTTANGFANPNGLTLSYSATGLPTNLTIDASTGVISGTLDKTASTEIANGIYAVTVTASDGQGGTATNTFKIVSANLAPVVGTKTSDETSSDGQTVTPVSTASAFSDANGDTLAYTASNLPAGLSIDQTTGMISGTVAPNAAPGTYVVTVTATDTKGAATLETFSWTVNDLAPTKNGTIADQTIADGTSGVSLATAGTFNNPNALAFVYSATGLPSGLTIDPTTGIISGHIDHDASKTSPNPGNQSGAYQVVVSAADGLGGVATQSFQIITTNQAPVLGAVTADQHSVDGNTASVDASSAFADPNAGDTVTYAATGLPKGLSINTATGFISGTIDKSASTNGPYTVIVTATDDKGALTTETFHWAVDNVAPVATPPLADRTVPDGSTVSYATVGGFTNPNALAFAYSATGLPSGLSIDQATGVISGTLNHDASTMASGGLYSIAVTVSDGQGGTATNTFVLVATNQAAIVGTNTADQTAQAGQVSPVVDASKAFTDPNGDLLKYSASNLPPGLQIDPATGVISGTIVAGTKPGVDLVTVTAIDDKGASSSETFQYTVGTPAPLVTGSFMPLTFADSTAGVAIDTAPGFTSPAGVPLTFSATGLPHGLIIDPTTGVISGFIGHDSSALAPVEAGAGATLTGTYTVLVTADNGRGGTAIQTIVIRATNSAPALGVPTLPQTSNDGDAVTLNVSIPFADPNIGDTVTFAASGLPKGLTINTATGVISGTVDRQASLSGPYEVVVTATDDKGAATAESFVWTVRDAVPLATGIAPVTAGDGVAITPIEAANGFSSPIGLPLTYSATGLPAGLTLDPKTGEISGTLDHDASKNAPVTTGAGATLDGIYTVVVTASDTQGGATSQSFTIDAKNAAPVTTGMALADQNALDGQAVAPVASAPAFADPNGDPLTFSATGLPAGLTIDPATGAITGTVATNATSGLYRVVVTATDDKGASVSESFVWTIADTAPFVVTRTPDQANVEGTTITPVRAGDAFSDPYDIPLTFSATGLPSGLSIDPKTGVISGTLTPGATQPENYVVVVTATDENGVASTETFAWHVGRVAPSVLVMPTSPSGLLATPIGGYTVDGSARTASRDPVLADDLRVDGVILETVREISGDPSESVILRADDVVIATVNNISPLDGLQSIDGRGAIVRNGAATNVRGDRFERTFDGLGNGLEVSVGTTEFIGSSLRDSSFIDVGDGAAINVETLIRDRTILIDIDNRSSVACVVPVQAYTVTGLDGEALPSWLHANGKGLLTGKIPGGVDRIDLRVHAILTNGVVLERHITIGTTTGVIRQGSSASRPHAGLSLSQMVAAARGASSGRGIAHLLD